MWWGQWRLMASLAYFVVGKNDTRILSEYLKKFKLLQFLKQGIRKKCGIAKTEISPRFLYTGKRRISVNENYAIFITLDR
jgi:hypothetical protein